MSDQEFRLTYNTGNDVKIWPVLKCRDGEKDRTAVLELNGHNNTIIQFTPMKVSLLTRTFLLRPRATLTHDMRCLQNSRTSRHILLTT